MSGSNHYHSHISEITTNPISTPTFLTSHEIRGAMVWRTGSYGINLSNFSVLRLSRFTGSRETHSGVVLHGGTGIMLVPVDVSKRVPHFVAGDALGLGVPFRPLILRQSIGCLVQIATARHRQWLPDGIWTSSKPDRGPRPSIPIELFHFRFDPGTPLGGTGLQPLSLPQAVALAKLQEDKFNDRRRGPRPATSFSSQNPPSPTPTTAGSSTPSSSKIPFND